MFEQIINYIGETALKHTAVKTFKYQSRSLINQQNSNGYMEFVIEDNTYLQQIITQNIFTATINIDILGFPKNNSEILTIQNDAMQTAVEVMAYIDNDDTFLGQLSIHDYDILLLSHFTDDEAAGVRLSLEIIIPNPLDICTYKDNFNEETEIEEDTTLDLTSAPNTTTTASKTLTLKPMKLKTKA